ncbi:MAG: hypothetical protein IPO52_14395 [Gemmatimonadetes bacterium]|jgi:hypothetical protein|nr:hypothetical protein [Gemmatimonadota bacterium]
MTIALRQRVSHAGMVGLVAAALAVSIQYFVAFPVGNQPNWLALLSAAAAAPSAYVVVPVRAPIEGWIQMEIGGTSLREATTPFGPALRGGTDDFLLIALGTIIMVGIVAYLAEGVQEMVTERGTTRRR